ncbi:glycogen/starch synthase [Arthrobacter sp. AL12]|uniref:glycogen/starch synthase n=1 Tax=Arthrobacter sp. AL12 TaxID=3042241 RepID=UPI002499F163|nr:glycogen/starch synthase [Arthrobacter sp. AL12]MDI3213976.1 glycogen/starch synthase [Arthrobacter sp. AL12]
MQIPAPFEYLRTPVMDTALAGGHSPLPPTKPRPPRHGVMTGADEPDELGLRPGPLWPRTHRVLFASAEAYPYVKVGGLADVSSALPKRLAQLGFDVRLVIPGYRGLGGSPVLTFDVPLGPVAERVVVRRLTSLGGVEVFTLGLPGWFDREVPYSYQDDDVMPFVLFSKAVTTLAALDPWRPHVIHGNDWHCGLVAQEARQGPYRRALARTGIVFTIHNIAYQGRVGAATEQLIGLPPAGTLLERGITFADRVNTVSPRYMQEILTPAQGAGMDGLLRARGDTARGILNGIDYEEFDPWRDPWIHTRYDGSFVAGKAANKEVLQRVSNLQRAPNRPLFGMVARLVSQKGVGLLSSALDQIVARGAQVVVMGEGAPRYRRELQAAVRRLAGNVAYHPTTQEPLARQIYAGADLFLAPSVFEPCGLTPLIALRYGTIPVVRRTGGLADTVKDYTEDPAAGLGFVFVQRRVASMLSAVDSALAIYRRVPEWHRLQQRAMEADFSWRAPAREYIALYDEAVRSRCEADVVRGPDGARGAHVVRGPYGARGADVERAPRPPGASQAGAPTSRSRPRPALLPLALVHHANQYLVTDGYQDREGLTSIVTGYAALLKLHEKYRTPVALHLSGTMVEAVAWHHPWFLAEVRRLRGVGLLSLIGGTYSENVLTAFDPEFNRRQLHELFWLYRRHLGCAPEDLEICWIPERVWDTERLAGILTDPKLPNGGYRYVLLDDRLLYPTGGAHGGSDRADFDGADPASPPPADALRPYFIEGGNGMQVVPMSTRLRYWIPPDDRRHWRSLSRAAELPTAPGDDTILVYADDMEKSAGVGPWHPSALGRYEEFLRWLATQPHLLPVDLPSWLRQRRRVPGVRVLERGTFVELAQDWHAGEDYRGWDQDLAWRPYQEHLARARRAVAGAERAGADPRLTALAWKHLLASGYETAWHDTEQPGRPPAAWAKAVASHARATGVLAAAARWFGSPARPLGAELVDLDDDGTQELVLRNEHLFAVLAPACGGRLVYLACRGPDGGVLVIGNPTDDWNRQEDLNSYMDVPGNHPGGLADVGGVHDRHEARIHTGDGVIRVELVNVQADSALHRLRKQIVLDHTSTALLVAYELPPAAPGITVETCLSPDYYRLLRHGSAELRRGRGRNWQGASNRGAGVWLALADDEDTTWCDPAGPEPGHGVLVRVHAGARSFHLLIGVGDVDDDVAARAMRTGLDRLAGQPGEPSSRDPVGVRR